MRVAYAMVLRPVRGGWECTWSGLDGVVSYVRAATHEEAHREATRPLERMSERREKVCRKGECQ